MSHHPRLLGALTLGLFAVAMAAPTNSVHAQKEKAKPKAKTAHGVLVDALHQTHRAHFLLAKLPPVFGGHRVKAMKEMDLAITQMKEALKYVKFDYKPLPTTHRPYSGKIHEPYTKQGEGHLKKYPHPKLKASEVSVILRAEHDTRKAVTDLKSLKAIYGGHRAKAIVELGNADTEMDLAIKFISKK
jgi:hypothetical protein